MSKTYEQKDETKAELKIELPRRNSIFKKEKIDSTSLLKKGGEKGMKKEEEKDKKEKKKEEEKDKKEKKKEEEKDKREKKKESKDKKGKKVQIRDVDILNI